MADRSEALTDLIQPVVADLALSLYDVELVGSGGARTLRVSVSRDGGGPVDLGVISALTEALSPVLDASDEPALRTAYSLEVSSPGLERPLRRPEHFRGAIGSVISVKHEGEVGTVRVRGTVVRADDDGVDLEVDGDERRVQYAEIVQARTVFEWGATKPERRQGRAKQKAAS